MEEHSTFGKTENVEIIALIESAFGGKNATRYDLVTTSRVEGFLDNADLMTATDLEYKKTMNDLFDDVMDRVREIVDAYPQTDENELFNRLMGKASLLTIEEIYLEHPTVCVAWLVKSHRWGELY